MPLLFYANSPFFQYNTFSKYTYYPPPAPTSGDDIQFCSHTYTLILLLIPPVDSQTRSLYLPLLLQERNFIFHSMTMTIFSVASNRKKTNLVSQYANTLIRWAGIEGKEGDSMSYSVLLLQVRIYHLSTDGHRAASSVGKGSLGGGDTRSTLSSFFVFPDAPMIDWRRGANTISRFERSPSLRLLRVALRICLLCNPR